METKHTPGPWDATINAESKRISVAESHAMPGCLIADINYRQDGTHYANALLIAAAPELLEALEYIVGAHEHPWATERGSRRGVLDHVPPALERAKAAIAKARGE